MKILSITAQKPHSTGSGTYMTELVRSFDRAGHTQAVVCGIYPDDEVSFPEGVNYYPVYFTDTAAAPLYQDHESVGTASSSPAPDASGAKGSRPQGPVLPFPVTGMSDIMPYTSTRYRDLTPEMIDAFESAFMESVGRAVSDLDPDLIICHHLFLLTAFVRKHFPDRRICGISHGTDLRQMRNCPKLREIVRPYVRDLDLLLALHEDQSIDIKELFGADDSKVKVIGSGYNSSLFNTSGRVERTADEPVRICYAGKISRPKGVPEMLKALAVLDADPSIPEFRLKMAGGCQDEALKPVLEDLPGYIEYLGQIPQPALAGLLRQTDIFVLPSYFEGLPLVLIEAMASGAAPISTDLPGVQDWINANVSKPNIIYVPMPALKSIDEPTDAGREAFIADLADAIGKAVLEAVSSSSHDQPDTSSVTWDGVAQRLLNFFL